MGYAKALGKPLVGLKTDYRTFSEMEEVNLRLQRKYREIEKMK
jgi:nucleoside 2-deoxyribosyltransferase